ncbi:MAG: hypothetical protein KME07_04290 [Pegethrix bostrychoides GSE-TBD4-15B]|uniref:Uncharacterized protein n=1 Tax=Pegethrix bostrychoides GSE-TBD4-15B TaxID=2839662 RepID=A0A951P8D9_9CYAN|nr:hypothetical protein [Pegethrix bostrychoides GSE-TBD4-15B]
MIGKPPDPTRMLRAAGLLVKYYLLAWFCFTVLCLMLIGLGAFHLLSVLLMTLGLLLARLAIFLFCFVAVAAIAEAWKYW